MGTEAATCSSCMYWREPAGSGVTGQCRRGPPVPQLEDDEFFGAWPGTDPHDWCGEWRTAEPAGGDE